MGPGDPHRLQAQPLRRAKPAPWGGQGPLPPVAGTSPSGRPHSSLPAQPCLAFPLCSGHLQERPPHPHFLGSLTQDKGGCRVDS